MESPRRRHDRDVKKSDDSEPLFEWDVGVAGGVSAPLSCIMAGAWDPRVTDRKRVGESGGVETVLRFKGLECLRPGTASLYPSLISVLMLVSSWICGLSLGAIAEPEASD